MNEDGISVLFGVVKQQTTDQDGKGSTKTTHLRQGRVYSTSTNYQDVLKPRDRSEILSAFIQLIDTVDISKVPVNFSIKPDSRGSGYIVDREWGDGKGVHYET